MCEEQERREKDPFIQAALVGCYDGELPAKVAGPIHAAVKRTVKIPGPYRHTQVSSDIDANNTQAGFRPGGPKGIAVSTAST